MIFRYEIGNTRLHHLYPLSKLAAVFVFSLLMVVVGGLWIQIIGLAVLAGIDYAAGSKKLHRRLSSGFVSRLAVTIFLMQLLFTHAGNTWLRIPLPVWTLVITDLGVETAVIMTLKFMNVLLCGGMFSATTDPVALVYSLMKAGVPYRYGFMILMMLRFVPLFESEKAVIGNAQKMRGLDLDGGCIKKLFLSIRYTLLPMIVSALSKADHLVLSMEGRAFGYRRTRTFMTPLRYSTADKLVMAASAVILMLLITGASLGWKSLRLLQM